LRFALHMKLDRFAQAVHLTSPVSPHGPRTTLTGDSSVWPDGRASVSIEASPVQATVQSL